MFNGWFLFSVYRGHVKIYTSTCTVQVPTVRGTFVPYSKALESLWEQPNKDVRSWFFLEELYNFKKAYNESPLTDDFESLLNFLLNTEKIPTVCILYLKPHQTVKYISLISVYEKSAMRHESFRSYISDMTYKMKQSQIYF